MGDLEETSNKVNTKLNFLKLVENDNDRESWAGMMNKKWKIVYKKLKKK